MRLLLWIAVLVALPIAAVAQEAAHGVEVLLPPSHDARKERSAQRQTPSEVTPSQEVVDSRDAPPLVVVTAAPPPVTAWERPAEIEVVRLEQEGDVVVYSPAPGPSKLQGDDIRYHGIAEARQPSRIRTHSGQPDTPRRILYHDWRSADPSLIPYARTGGALTAQGWNASGVRFRASRIRYHGSGQILRGHGYASATAPRSPSMHLEPEGEE